MDNNNDGPPIQPVHQKEVLKNETPTMVSEAASCVLLFLEKYGWFVILGVVLYVLIWSNFEPYWRKWKKKREKQYEETIDPERLIKCQASQEMSHRRMQENVDVKSVEFAEKMKELEAKKQQEKIDDFEMHQQGRGYRSKHPKTDDRNQKENKAKPKKSARLRNSDYNPLSGSSSGTSFRPNSRSTGGG